MKKARSKGFSPDVKESIWDRARGCCERCGLGLSVDGGGADFHHRSPRGSGGRKEEWVNLPANGVLLCRPCHSWVETHRVEAEKDGWLVSRIGFLTAADVPIVDLNRNTFWLDDQGGREVSGG